MYISDRRRLLIIVAVACLLLVLLRAGCRRHAQGNAGPAAPPVAVATPQGASPATPTPAAAPAESAAESSPMLLDIPPRYKGKTVRNRVKGFTEKLLALTFDDGPNKDITPRILASLKKRGVHATFFELGSCISGNEALVKRIFDEGHVVGIHSYNHLSSASPEKAKSEITRTAALIEQATGQKPRVFRPPYGITIGNLNKEAVAEGYVSLLWTITSADTDRHATVLKIANNIIHTPNPGDIVLMHDGSGHDLTARAVPQVLDELGAAGWKFVTIPELLQAWDKWQQAQAPLTQPAK